MTAPTLTGCRCQCVACGDYFGNVVGFDRHRVGDFGAGRRCLTAGELVSRRWIRNERGFWLRPSSGRGPAALQGHDLYLPATTPPCRTSRLAKGT
jgi:hypothetical protein